MKKYFYMLFYINKILQFLRKQNIITTTKFLSYIIKNIKHFNEKG